MRWKGHPVVVAAAAQQGRRLPYAGPINASSDSACTDFGDNVFRSCRYKLVIQVTVGQKQGQAMRIISRCLWDQTNDNFASEYYENESMYCVCQVYGLYYE